MLLKGKQLNIFFKYICILKLLVLIYFIQEQLQYDSSFTIFRHEAKYFPKYFFNSSIRSLEVPELSNI